MCNDHEEAEACLHQERKDLFFVQFLRELFEIRLMKATPLNVVRKSSFWSIDNAHGIHPNYSDKHDDNHSPHLNAGR